MFLERIPAGVYGANCYILGCEETGKAAVVDPGGDAVEILEYIEKSQLDLSFILLTHGHGDHIGGIPDIIKAKGVPVLIHREDAYLLEDPEKNLSIYMSGPKVSLKADKLLTDGDIVPLGNIDLKIIHTPGHTLGSICIFTEDLLFSGDTLFANSIGRTDLEGGSFKKIIDSILNKLFSLPEDTRVMPGHGPATSLKIEKLTNPFVNQ
ncbi:MAG: MBL fold metallo-hydrolase [Thermotaleaceae bacterium]